MSSGCKPGTVAMIRTKSGDSEALAIRDTHGWAHLRDYESKLDAHSIWSSAGQVTVVRPLVVIDPEDREQVERLWSLIDAAEDETLDDFTLDSDQWAKDAVQAALREFADPKPPKPEEPTGLGAVVEQDDEQWVHFGNGCWIKTVPNAALRQRGWGDFSPAVRVLSEGVQA